MPQASTDIQARGIEASDDASTRGRKRFSLPILICWTLGLTLLLGLGWQILTQSHDEPQSFDQNLWQESSYQSGVRLPMVDDLIDRHLPAQLTYASVRDLLGPEDWAKPHAQGSIFGYGLGYIDRFHLIVLSQPRMVGYEPDGYWIEFYADSNDVVTKLRVCSHFVPVIREVQLLR